MKLRMVVLYPSSRFRPNSLKFFIVSSLRICLLQHNGVFNTMAFSKQAWYSKYIWCDDINRQFRVDYLVRSFSWGLEAGRRRAQRNQAWMRCTCRLGNSCVSLSHTTVFGNRWVRKRQDTLQCQIYHTMLQSDFVTIKKSESSHTEHWRFHPSQSTGRHLQSCPSCPCGHLVVCNMVDRTL